jgi:hypothetical protein
VCLSHLILVTLSLLWFPLRKFRSTIFSVESYSVFHWQYCIGGLLCNCPTCYRVWCWFRNLSEKFFFKRGVFVHLKCCRVQMSYKATLNLFIVNCQKWVNNEHLIFFISSYARIFEIGNSIQFNFKNGSLKTCYLIYCIMVKKNISYRSRDFLDLKYFT